MLIDDRIKHKLAILHNDWCGSKKISEAFMLLEWMQSRDPAFSYKLQLDYDGIFSCELNFFNKKYNSTGWLLQSRAIVETFDLIPSKEFSKVYL